MKKIDIAVIALVATVLFYAAILFFTDIDIIIKRIYEINFAYLPIIFLLMAVHTAISGLKYHRLLLKVGIVIAFKESLKIFICGLSMNVTPLGVGTALKSHILKKKYGKSLSSSLPVVLIERLTEMLAILIIVTVLLLWANLYESKILLAIGYALIGFFIIVISNSRAYFSFKRIFMKLSYTKKLIASLDESRESVSMLTKKNVLVEALILSLVAKIAVLVAIYLIFLSVSIDLGFTLAGQIYYTSLLLGTLTLIPGGIIVTESGMLGLLLKHGVEFSLATLIVIFTRMISMWLFTIIGTFTLRHISKE